MAKTLLSQRGAELRLGQDMAYGASTKEDFLKRYAALTKAFVGAKATGISLTELGIKEPRRKTRTPIPANALPQTSQIARTSTGTMSRLGTRPLMPPQPNISSLAAKRKSILSRIRQNQGKITNLLGA